MSYKFMYEINIYFRGKYFYLLNFKFSKCCSVLVQFRVCFGVHPSLLITRIFPEKKIDQKKENLVFLLLNKIHTGDDFNPRIWQEYFRSRPKTLLGPELHLYIFCDVFIVNTSKIISHCTDITGKQCLLTCLLIDGLIPSINFLPCI